MSEQLNGVEYELERFNHYHDGERFVISAGGEIVHTVEEEDGTLSFWVKRPVRE